MLVSLLEELNVDGLGDLTGLTEVEFDSLIKEIRRWAV